MSDPDKKCSDPPAPTSRPQTTDTTQTLATIPETQQMVEFTRLQTAAPPSRESRQQVVSGSEPAPRDHQKLETKRSMDSPMTFKNEDSIDQPPPELRQESTETGDPSAPQSAPYQSSCVIS
ncbi:hypothetical protein NL108_014288 [Boleophthalmus pectinirostris]|nr:hypothetical protein NL108_014288 [Boleophthalmus pectinirostris]